MHDDLEKLRRENAMLQNQVRRSLLSAGRMPYSFRSPSPSFLAALEGTSSVPQRRLGGQGRPVDSFPEREGNALAADSSPCTCDAPHPRPNLCRSHCFIAADRGRNAPAPKHTHASFPLRSSDSSSGVGRRINASLCSAAAVSASTAPRGYPRGNRTIGRSLGAPPADLGSAHSFIETFLHLLSTDLPAPLGSSPGWRTSLTAPRSPRASLTSSRPLPGTITRRSRGCRKRTTSWRSR